jgi:arsenite methyltransferase
MGRVGCAERWRQRNEQTGQCPKSGGRVEDFVRHYYGEVLEQTSDLKTDACCTTEAPPPHVSQLLANIHPEVSARYYGCGLVVPEALEGCRVLDLGCGAGRDCYLLAQLVGERGEVVGVDMTEAQLAIARRHRDYHRERFGYPGSNVSFHLGRIEQLDELALEPQSFDVIVSNCVLNLSTDKQAVLRSAYALLKPGGEMYFADVYANRRVPAEVSRDPVLYGECLGGALYWNDFHNRAKAAGFKDPRLVTDRPIKITDARIRTAVRGVGFHSATYRLFKVATLEPACEDYGQAVVYRGTLPDHRDRFVVDKHHVFPSGKAIPVCGNTFDMLRESRFGTHFEFIGDKSTHYGIFDGCGTVMPFDMAGAGTAGSPDTACC